MSSQQQHSKPGGFKHDLNITIGWAQCIAKVLEAWFRIPGSCGSRYFGGQALIGWIALLLVATAMRSQPLLEFWVTTGGVFLLQRLVHESRRRKGYKPHSQYVGDSYLRFLGGNRLAYRLWEPLFTILVGYALARNGDGYASVVILMGLCLWLSAMYSVASEQARLTAIEDARAEQAWLAEYTKSSQ